MNKNNTTNRIYNHNFDNNADKRNYIYDAINKTTAPKQPLVKIPTNGAIKTNFQSQIQITTPMGILNQGNLGCCGPNALAIAMCIATRLYIQVFAVVCFNRCVAAPALYKCAVFADYIRYPDKFRQCFFHSKIKSSNTSAMF